MKEKYDPKMILSHMCGKFFGIKGHENVTINDYSIFIEIKNLENQCYRIGSTNNCPALHIGYCRSTSWTEIRDHEILFKNKDQLGRVHIRFKNKPIKINGQSIESFEAYDSFWDFIFLGLSA